MYNPQHLNIENSLYIINNIRNKKKIYLTPKADGIKTKLEYKNINYLTEKIDNNYYIFDLFDYEEKIFENYKFRIKFIQNNFNKIFIKECDDLHDFYDHLNSDPIFCDKINNFNLYLKPISILNYLKIDENKIFDFLDNFKNISPINNDGSILYFEDCNYPIKLKKRKKLSIDIKYNNDNFFCFENSIINLKNNDKLIFENELIYEYNLYSKEIIKRNDKKYANKKKTCIDIIYLYRDSALYL